MNSKATHTSPALVTTVDALRAALSRARDQRLSVGLVPTMGALHAGHLSLVDASVARCDFTVVTIFVNPTQFGPHEDFNRYPRNLEADLALLAGRGTDLVFAPDVESIYRPGHATYVEIGGAALPWEGTHRPGHFRGVATVVLKLFNLVGADVAFFGQKDYQQCQVIAQMVREFDVPIELSICPIVREPDGLALSSRNVYLSPTQREQALVLSRALRLGAQQVARGGREAPAVLAAMQAEFERVAEVRLDYLAIVDPTTLVAIEWITEPAMALVAARVGATRLIDNIRLEPPA